MQAQRGTFVSLGLADILCKTDAQIFMLSFHEQSGTVARYTNHRVTRVLREFLAISYNRLFVKWPLLLNTLVIKGGQIKRAVLAVGEQLRNTAPHCGRLLKPMT